MRRPRFRAAIVAVYKHQPALTLQQIADKVGGCSGEYVRQVLAALRAGRSRVVTCFCGAPAKVKGHCNKHYQNLRKHGDPFGLTGRREPLTGERARAKSRVVNRRNSLRKGFAHACAVAEGNRAPLKGGPRANATPEYMAGERLAAVYLGLRYFTARSARR